MLDATRLAETLTDRYGIAVAGKAAVTADGQCASFWPEGIEKTQGFTIKVTIGWKTVTADFVPASFARPLIQSMERADTEKRLLFRTYIQAALNQGAAVSFRINDNRVDPVQTDAWPVNWSSLSLSFIKGPMEINGRNPEVASSLALEWGGRLLACTLSLLTLEPVSEHTPGEAEGAAYQALVTRYERSKLNREACIGLRGARCLACGFDFERVYGEVGTGFIEIHHVESIALMEANTKLDPATDLVPLCSNCHSMAHKRRPVPFTVDEIKSMIESARQTCLQS